MKCQSMWTEKSGVRCILGLLAEISLWRRRDDTLIFKILMKFTNKINSYLRAICVSLEQPLAWKLCRDNDKISSINLNQIKSINSFYLTNQIQIMNRRTTLFCSSIDCSYDAQHFSLAQQPSEKVKIMWL